MKNPLPAALIFDVDGTLAETEEAHRRAFNLAFAEFGLDWFWDRALYAELLKVAGGKERYVHYARSRGPAECENALRILPELHVFKTTRYTEMVANGEVPLRPGVVRLITEALRNRVALGIATTTHIRNVEALVRIAFRTAVPEIFRVVVAGDMVPAKKPAPDVYLRAIQDLGIERSRSLVFEDTAVGLASALRAGLRTIVTPSSYSQGEDFTGAFRVVPNLGDPGAPVESLVETDGYGFVDLKMLSRWLPGSDMR
jgi:HAD superfamily hydrolase (TIGR01509 family)